MTYEIPEYLIMSKARCDTVGPSKSTKEMALEECIDNYEEAMRLSQLEVKQAQKKAKEAVKRFDKLVKIVECNVSAKQAKAILNQVK